MGMAIYIKWNEMPYRRGTTKWRDALREYATSNGLPENNKYIPVGELWENYIGGPYALFYLFREAFDDNFNCFSSKPVHIPAKKLRKRLPKTKKKIIKKHRGLIKEAFLREKFHYSRTNEELSSYIQAFEDFVQLAEVLEKNGNKPTMYAST